ncbi:MAG: hypothetical protein ACO1N0_18055 [Fluviicola sp.]
MKITVTLLRFSIWILSFTCMLGCSGQEDWPFHSEEPIREQKFNKRIWNEIDGSYNPRDPMVKDIMENHLYIGMKYADVINLLGDSTMKMDKNQTISYEVYFDNYTELNKCLTIQFTNDSLVKSFKKVEWTN